jgi:hypothetical protein
LHRLAFKGPTKDDYAQPAATYEMAVLAWVEAENPKLRKQLSSEDAKELEIGEKETKEWRRKKVEECEAWLDKVAKWEAFVLDARIGMRVQTGMDTLRWVKRENGWGAV